MANEDYKKIAEHYQELSNIYQCVYEDLIDDILIVGELQGVYVEISSDCIKYKQKTKKSATQAENRLQVIEKAIKHIDYLINEKERQSRQVKILTHKYCEAKEKIKELERIIEISEKMWEEEISND